MIIKYPVNTFSQHDAIEMAKSLARTHGFTKFLVISVRKEAPSSWTITLDAVKQ